MFNILKTKLGTWTNPKTGAKSTVMIPSLGIGLEDAVIGATLSLAGLLVLMAGSRISGAYDGIHAYNQGMKDAGMCTGVLVDETTDEDDKEAE